MYLPYTVSRLYVQNAPLWLFRPFKLRLATVLVYPPVFDVVTPGAKVIIRGTESVHDSIERFVAAVPLRAHWDCRLSACNGRTQWQRTGSCLGRLFVGGKREVAHHERGVDRVLHDVGKGPRGCG